MCKPTQHYFGLQIESNVQPEHDSTALADTSSVHLEIMPATAVIAEQVYLCKVNIT